MFEDHDNDERNYDSVKKMPIYQKALDILNLSRRITALIEEEHNELSKEYGNLIMEDASILAPKIAGAEMIDLYDLKMENATIVRKAARDVFTHCTGLKMTGFKEVEYLELLRNEIETFRILFAQWVATFDPWNYIIDRWGLFNPPGVNYNDKDPDDDLPFNPDDMI